VERELVLRNDAAELARLAAEVGLFGKAAGLGEAAVHDLRLALEEVVSNIVRYAYRDRAEHLVRVRFVREGGGLRVEVADDGVPFNPLGVPPPDTACPLGEREPGGMGIYLVRHSMDSVEYRRDGETNLLTMTKDLDPAKEPRA
jgi:anti-sigma regulatory factor (Ser/Thr protein kinase)